MTWRVVLITGGAGGMGRAIARRFLDDGDVVVLADRADGSLSDAQAELGDISVVRADVASVDDCVRMVAETVRRHGRLDVLVAAAGVWVEGPTVQMTEAQWNRTVDVNLKGVFFACRAAIPPLEATEGCIVAVSSDYGLVGGPGAAIYCATKFGVNGIVRSLALELDPRGVRVNSVCPSDVDTPMLAGQARDYGGDDPDRYLRDLMAGLPQRERARFITPEEIAHVVWFLAAPLSAPITGHTMPVEWGVTTGY